MDSAPLSPTISVTSSTSASSSKSAVSGTSRFKNIKKKIKSTFKMGKRASLAQVDQVLKRSIEFENGLVDGSLEEDASKQSSSLVQFQTEFKALKEALENMINESKTLQMAVKTADSNCPDPFDQPENFSLYLAKMASSNFMLSDEADFEDAKTDSPSEIAQMKVEIEKLKALKLADESLHQAERDAFAAAMAQLEVLKGELEQVNKQNASFMSQIAQLKQNNSAAESGAELTRLQEKNKQLSVELESKNSEFVSLKAELEQARQETREKGQELEEAQIKLKELEEARFQLRELDQVRLQLRELEQTREQVESLKNEVKHLQDESEVNKADLEVKVRELTEANARLSLELKEAQLQLRDYEKENLKEPVESVAESIAEEIDFKYTYLSNVILQYLQRPEQRPELIKVLATTLELSPEEKTKLRL